MKNKKISKKLNLNKQTISNLHHRDMSRLKAGAHHTVYPACNTDETVCTCGICTSGLTNCTNCISICATCP
jgi:hypothetical protein